jgi:hypothetical protein
MAYIANDFGLITIRSRSAIAISLIELRMLTEALFVVNAVAIGLILEKSG